MTSQYVVKLHSGNRRSQNHKLSYHYLLVVAWIVIFIVSFFVFFFVFFVASSLVSFIEYHCSAIQRRISNLIKYPKPPCMVGSLTLHFAR